MLFNLLTGMLIGFFIAVPIGPIDMLCIRRTLLWGTRSGFITGLGAAFADAIYGASAAFGIITLTTFLIGYKQLFQLIGGIFLCCLGMKTFRTSNSEDTRGLSTGSLAFAFVTTFFLALMSPMTILSLVGAFSVLGVTIEGSSFDTALLLTLGVFAGSTLWWFILSSGVSLFRDKLNVRNLIWINRFSGVILISFGLTAIGMALLHFEDNSGIFT